MAKYYARKEMIFLILILKEQIKMVHAAKDKKYVEVKEKITGFALTMILSAQSTK